jgi:Domain of unknown function (DUF5916)
MPWSRFAVRAAACAAALATLAAGAATAAEATPRQALQLPAWAGAAPVLDGRLDEAGWATALVVQGFISTNGEASSRLTQLRLAHDGAHLHVAVRAQEPEPARIAARTLRRDAEAIEAEDHIALVLDPQGTGRNGFVFRVNALGARRDALVADGGMGRPEWDGLWDAAAVIDGEGWTAEFSLPLAMLAAPADGRPWGFNAERLVAATGERLRLYAAEPEREVESLGGIGALAGAVPTRVGWGLRLQPALRVVHEREGSGHERVQLKPALDAQYALTPSLTAALTLNTDFSDADLDEQNLSLSRYELFRPEKRSFFTQDAGRFGFGGLDNDDPTLLPFFSRRIGLQADVDAGLKVSGTAGPVELGVFAVQADAEGGQREKARMGVLRAATALGPSQRVGLIATEGHPDGRSGSRLAGLDYQFRSTALPGDRTLEAYAWALQSHDAELGTGEAQGVRLNFPNVGLTGEFMAERVGERFEPALGYVREAGVDRLEGNLGWWFRDEQGTSWIPRLFTGKRHRHDGREDSGFVGLGLEWTNARDDFVYLERFAERERVAEAFELLPGVVVPVGRHAWHFTTFGAGLSASHVLSGEVSLEDGGYFDGHLTAATAKLAWRPSMHWTLTGIWQQQAVSAGGGRAVAKAVSLRIDHAADTRSAQSLVVQHDNVSGQTAWGLRARWALAADQELRLALDRLAPVAAGEVESTLTLAWVWALER